MPSDLHLDSGLVLDAGQKISAIASELERARRAEYLAALDQRGAPWSLDPTGQMIGARYHELRSQWLKSLKSMSMRLAGIGFDISKVGRDFEAAGKQLENDASRIFPEQ